MGLRKGKSEALCANSCFWVMAAYPGKSPSAGLRSRPNFSDSDSDSDSGLEKSTPTPTPTPAPTLTYTSLFFHMSKSNVLKQWYLLCNAFDAKYCWQNWTAKFSKSLPGPRIVNWGDNYPAVNQNGLSDRNLPQVKVKCVLKTTDRVPPLPVDSFYGTEHHWFFQPSNPPKFIRQGQVTLSQSQWRCRLWLSSRLVRLKAN